MPDGTPAPAVLQELAAFPYGGLPVANADGVVQAVPMIEVLRYVCRDSIEDELEGDEETLAYLGELIDRFAAQFPGWGVALDPHTFPDPVLWIAPDGTATIMFYERDAFERREPLT
jgi:hypothetical protein